MALKLALKLKIQRPSAFDLTKLVQFCKEEWTNMFVIKCEKLAESYARRILAVTTAKGIIQKMDSKGLKTNTHHLLRFWFVTIILISFHFTIMYYFTLVYQINQLNTIRFVILMLKNVLYF